MKVKVKSLSHVRLFATPWTVAYQATLSVHGIFQARVLEWVAISFTRGIFPTQGLNLGLPHCKQTLYRLSHQTLVTHHKSLINDIICYSEGRSSRLKIQAGKS